MTVGFVTNSLKFYVHFFTFLIPNLFRGIVTQVTRLFLFLKPKDLLKVVNFLVKSSIIQGLSLVDIVVVDNITVISGRFCMTYCI